MFAFPRSNFDLIHVIVDRRKRHDVKLIAIFSHAKELFKYFVSNWIVFLSFLEKRWYFRYLSRGRGKCVTSGQWRKFPCVISPDVRCNVWTNRGRSLTLLDLCNINHAEFVSIKHSETLRCLWCYSECISTPDELEKYARPRWESNLRSLEYQQKHYVKLITQKHYVKLINVG
jgi:hypothetical protein